LNVTLVGGWQSGCMLPATGALLSEGLWYPLSTCQKPAPGCSADDAPHQRHHQGALHCDWNRGTAGLAFLTACWTMGGAREMQEQ